MAELIVYYSRSGENYRNGSIVKLTKGNTERIAEMIAGITGADLFELRTVKDYPADYHQCTEVAMAELRSQARPELEEYPESLDGYDTVYLGYPNWWGTMPMAVLTFLERYDFTGKRILPFCTNEGSGLGSSERDLKRACPTADVRPGLSIHGAEAGQSRAKVEAWLRAERGNSQ